MIICQNNITTKLMAKKKVKQLKGLILEAIAYVMWFVALVCYLETIKFE